MVRKPQEDEPKPREKAYEPPKVRLLGSLVEITRGPEGGAIDGLFGGIGGFTPPS